MRHRLAMYLHMKGVHLLCRKWRPDVSGISSLVYAEVHF